MQVVAKRKDGSEHAFIKGRWEPPIVVPQKMHEKVLRNVNAAREENQKRKEVYQ